MPANILHLIDTGGPGGAETVLRDIVTGLDSRRWRSIVAVPVRDWLYATLRQDGIDPVIASTHGSFDLRYLQRLHRLARSGTVLIHTHLLTSGVYGAMAGALSRVPVVCTFHGVVDVPDEDRFRKLKFRIINSLARAQVVFVSAALQRAFLDAVPLDPARTTVIPNGVDAARFHTGADPSLRQELGIGDGEILVGAIGNVRPSKSYDVLLRAAAILRERSAQYRFVIVGQQTGTLYEELAELHARLGLGEAVRFAGFRTDIPRVMRNLDIYVSSSRAEGFSLTTIEAMASGVPVVATRCGGPEEIVDDGVTGLLVPTNSPAALASAIDLLGRDADLRRRMSAASRAAVTARFTIEAMVSKYEALYDRCLMLRGQPAVQRTAQLRTSPRG